MAVSKLLLEQDRFSKLVKTNSTVVTLGSLTVTISVSGINGIDTGSVSASTHYYVYTVINNGQVRLVASLSATAPTGFTSYRKVGAFYTDSTSAIGDALYFGQTSTSWASAIFTGSWVSNTTYVSRLKRIDDTMYAEVLVETTGAPTSVSLDIILPSGMSIDTSKIPPNWLTGGGNVGTLNTRDAGIGTYAGNVTYNSPTSLRARYFDDAAAAVQENNVSQAAPFAYGAGDQVFATFAIPILGWVNLDWSR